MTVTLATPAVRSFRDLRGSAVDELWYPADAVLVVAGIPGAGKTTLLRRLFGDADVPVLDSADVRRAWRPRLAALPYRCWRPLVHAAHYARLAVTLRRTAGPVVVHDCATRPWARALIRRAAGDRPVHLLLLDVTPEQARTAQHARGRVLPEDVFARHCRRWPDLLDAARRPESLGAASATILDRDGAAGLRTVHFGQSGC